MDLFKRPARKDSLEKIQSLATIFSLIAVPIIVAVLGAMFQRSSQQAEERAKTLDLAIQILKDPSAGERQKGLRAWAVDMVQAASSEPLSEAAKKELSLKPSLSMQPVQRRFTTGGFDTLAIDSSAAPSKICSHKLKAIYVADDYALLNVDGTQTKIFVNESIVLPDNGAVLNLLGLSFDKSTSPKPYSAFVGFVCP